MGRPPRKQLEYVENSGYECAYGCGKAAHYRLLVTKKWVCSCQESQCPIGRERRRETAIRLWKNEDYRQSHHYGMYKDKWYYKSDDEIFCLNTLASQSTIGRYAKLRNIIEYKCRCGIVDKWLDLPITLQLHHKNGNKKDNRKENLLWLCPNCHTQTDNFGYKGKKKL